MIAMDDAAAVRLVHCGAHLIEDVDDPRRRETPFLVQDLGERAAVEILHHQIRDVAGGGPRNTEIGDVDDVGVAQAAGRLGLTPERGAPL
jgi:hypothetical protein